LKTGRNKAIIGGIDSAEDNTMRSFGLAVTSALCLLAADPAAAATIDVGNHLLLPNTPGQVFTIDVAGGDLVQGVDFFLQVADGGPEAAGFEDGPEITGVDILDGTIFDGNHTGEAAGGPLIPQFWQSGTTTLTGTVAAEGLLATVTIDTTGFFAGSWELLAKDTLMGDSNFPTTGVTTNVTNGRLTISEIPEPSTLALGLVLAGLGCLHGRRGRWV
jgi:hypothetical protein